MKKIFVPLLLLGLFATLIIQSGKNQTVLVAPNGREIPAHAPFVSHPKLQEHFEMEWIDFSKLPKKHHYAQRLYNFLFKPRHARVIFNNYHPFFSKSKIANLPKGRRTLIMWEPPSVLLEMYGQPVHKLFDRIYTWNDELVDGEKFFKFHYACFRPMREDLPSYDERQLVCMINSNLKFNNYKNELYSTRRTIARFFDEHLEIPFDLYGRNWEGYRNARGTIPDKFEVLKQYKFKVCFENTKDPGYVTEKIFDCFAVGTVPIYLGAPNIEEYVPKECFIDYRQFQSNEEMVAFIQNVSKERFLEYQAQIRKFLNSDQAKKFTLEAFANLMINDLD